MKKISQEFKERQRHIIQQRLQRYRDMQNPAYLHEIPERKKLKAKFIPILQQSLKHLDSDQYGVCIDCGKNIPLKRLKAVPAAFRCTECQSVFEEEHDVRRK